MNGMTTQERLNDICGLCGLSEDIVRRVFDAERQSIAKSLRKGERATLIGRCVIRPETRTKLAVGGNLEYYVKLKSSVTSSMEALLSGVSEFEVEGDENEEIPGIITNQIQALV